MGAFLTSALSRLCHGHLRSPPPVPYWEGGDDPMRHEKHVKTAKRNDRGTCLLFGSQRKTDRQTNRERDGERGIRIGQMVYPDVAQGLLAVALRSVSSTGTPFKRDRWAGSHECSSTSFCASGYGARMLRASLSNNLYV